ncbi:MAG TPA: NfeD family protein [Actinomycetales bacterium]|nr:NfeD family protein [Actinomycetales bacterium]
MSWITEHPALAWLALALALAAFEVASIDFVFLMFVGGALAGSGAAALGAPFVIQVLVAVAVSSLLLGVVRPLVMRRMHAGEPTLTGAAALIGQPASVVETVTQSGGLVKIGGEIWSARSVPTPDVGTAPPLLPGEAARVVSIDGATAVVASEPPYPQVS